MTGSTATRVRVRLTGGVALEVDGVPVEGLGRPARLALAYLVCERHRPVPRDELAELLWADDLPRSWEQLIRGIASRLRVALAKAGLDPAVALTTAFGAQQLHLPPGVAVDVEEAAEQLASARTALAAGAPDRAAGEAFAAASTAARQFLPEVEGTWVERRQTELRELRVQALEVLSAAEEARGHCSEAVVAAEQAVSLEPFRESAYLRLMTAHATAGNRGEALRVHERCRQVLSDELGVDPSPALSAAHLALLHTSASGEVGRHGAAGEPKWSLPLPAALAPVRGGFLVGRDAETKRLTTALDRAMSEGRQAVLVSGEPGIGKTALVAQLARQAHAAGARVLYGRCDEDLGVPYQPFAEALGDYVAHCPIAGLTAHVAAHGGELSRLVPELSRRLPGLPPSAVTDPEVDRYRLFQAVNGLLAMSGSSAPTAVILDDLHWATSATLLLLRHVLSAPARQGLLLIATYRHTDVGPSHPLAATLADLRRQRGVERLRLEGLDEDGVLAFVRTAGGTPDDEDVDLSHALYASTAGNPFFVGEMLRYLGETGGVYRRLGEWSYYADGGDLGVPEGVREVVERRLGRLSEPAGRALAAAAVIGGDVDLSLLERVVGPADASAVVDAVEEAAGARLLMEQERPGRYRFAHALVRATIYDSLARTRRMRLHLRVAEALEALPGDRIPRLPALAHHFAEAAPLGGAGIAADYALAAARADFANAAWEDAAARLERGIAVLAAEETPDAERRCDLLVLLAETWTRFWEPARIRAAATAALEAARTLGSTDHRLAEAGYWFARSRDGSPEEFRAVEELVDDLRAALGDSDPAALARVLAPAGAYRLLMSDGADSTESREAIALARASGDSRALGVALWFRCQSLRGSPSVHEHLALADTLVCAAPPDVWDGWRSGHDQRAHARLALGDRAGFEVDVAGCERVGSERGFWYFRWVGALRRGALALIDGRFDEVEPLAALARDAWKMQEPFGSICYWRQVVAVSCERGDAAAAAAAAARLVADAPDNQIHRAMFAFTKAQLVGVAEARADLEAFVDVGLGPMGVERRPVTLAYRTEVALSLGGSERARMLHDELLPWAGQIVVGGFAEAPLGAVDRYLGMLGTAMGRWDDAEARFKSALHLEDGLASPPLLARTQYWYGRMLLARAEPADLERAGELLRSSRDATQLLGMARLHDQAVALLGEVRT